jgi:serine/threonine protein phosphatase PrpC
MAGSTQTPVPGLAVAGHTDTGRLRQHNEDAYLLLPEQGFFLVADGLGGHEGGEIASATAVEHVGRHLPEVTDWSDPAQGVAGILAGADRAVHARSEGPLRGMGTTAVGLLLRGNRFYTIHAGDSRAYRLADGDELEQLTIDHTPENESGLAPASGRRSGMITRAIGVGEATEFDLCTGETAPGDRFLLCSDGLTDAVADEDIAGILAEEPVPETAARRLVDAANAAGGPDNITVVIIHLE